MQKNLVTPPSSPQPKRVFSPQKRSRQVFDRFAANATKTAVQLKRKWSDELSLREAIQTQIDPDSPIKEQVTPDKNPHNSAYSIRTKSGAKLQKTFETENFAVYSQNGNLRNEFSGEELKSILNTLFDGVDTIPYLPAIEPNSKKIQAATVTLKHRKSAKKKPHRDQSHAITNNNGQVRANKDIADIYFTEENLDKVAVKLEFDEEKKAQLKKQFLNLEAEWIHLVDYANIGEKGQCSENLVFGSKEANSQMIVIEQFIERILKKSWTAEIKVEAAICKLHMAYEIQYLLTVVEIERTINITFNPFTRELPIPELIQYLGLVEKALEGKQHAHNPIHDTEEEQPSPKIYPSIGKNLFAFFDSDSMQEDNLTEDPDLLISNNKVY